MRKTNAKDNVNVEVSEQYPISHHYNYRIEKRSCGVTVQTKKLWEGVWVSYTVRYR